MCLEPQFDITLVSVTRVNFNKTTGLIDSNITVTAPRKLISSTSVTHNDIFQSMMNPLFMYVSFKNALTLAEINKAMHIKMEEKL